MPNTWLALQLRLPRLWASGLDSTTVEATTLHPDAFRQRDGGHSHDSGHELALTPTALGCENPKSRLGRWTPTLHLVASDAFSQMCYLLIRNGLIFRHWSDTWLRSMTICLGVRHMIVQCSR